MEKARRRELLTNAAINYNDLHKKSCQERGLYRSGVQLEMGCMAINLKD
jgi:hypothetical protein